ncbi:MAG: nif-specific transcriptional activator NifA [Candidatus Dactylopiibacterium carminicum]|uniref:Nif-specific regulatory protein n=1 Tax=Candidatus Dactylopiibacterium carminicum TaxID=857335 RepID=A0A272EY52_9RHOO|nr:nif-specific transcriptional activator NifA [Candidatus Dactylopiibacterium carminicum]KAF7600431.1 nif-specific transcriptional activator NifA [Candidatus Dactylopiibacterium carminicum]PAS95052.1 MAG: nif-specific transcriptional activator NifA [Candidatus Dactylopiibacterium carminicum]PAS97839.1 MAG: nif-specific transcriptional activator NifA [Candidatus Dactylopiibacterium carminicum]PAT00430.1 MAG: nif-specific transcriptional activator NifA [Candidatus Dactylopiibacterium carminicum]
MALDAEGALNRTLMETLYSVSVILSRALDVKQAPHEILRVLEESAGLTRGMISVLDPESGELVVNAVQGIEPEDFEPVRYQSGEGVLGLILEEGKTLALPAVSSEPRFLNRLGIYERRLPFVAAPIHVGGALQGVLAVQPNRLDDGLLPVRARFVEMVANLIGQSVKLSLDVAEEKKNIAEERDTLRRTVRAQHGFDNIVGHSMGMRKIFEQIRMVSKWNTTVLIRGETGTGKELIANAIHYNSPRARGPYVRLNCASLPENLLESELFGHEKGAFTGAVAQRRGRFEMADGGTIFLDEIGEISPAFQAKLLRVLQEGELERVGGGRTLKVDVRVIAATHRDLEDAVDAGKFREDLYFRLNVMPIKLPALRERLEDVPEIGRHLLVRIGQMQGRALNLTEAALTRLTQYTWPGNVRELENCLERAAVMSESGHIDADLIRIDRQREVAGGAMSSAASRIDLEDPSLDERTRVIAALEQAGWVQAKAARLLNMTPRQIAYRILTLGIEVKQF